MANKKFHPIWLTNKKVSFLGWAFLPFSPKLRINREARVFDQITSDQASGSLKHDYNHLQDLRDDPFQMTRPNVGAVNKHSAENASFWEL